MGLFNFFKPKSYSDKLAGQQPVVATVAGELLTVTDVFLIKGRGVIVTGHTVAPIRVGQAVVIRGASGDLSATVASIEAMRMQVEYVDAGNDAGILLSGIERAQITSGDKLIVG